MPATEEQVVISSAGRALAGMLHRPSRDAQELSAFLFCHPFAEEKKCSHRTFVELARALAAAGHGVLRFDLFGCGDSPGDFGQATIGDWLDDLRAARRFLARALPGRGCALLGLRLGATLAALVAAEDPPASRLALIEPVLNGREYFAADLRRMLIKQMMTDGSSQLRREEIIRRLESGQGELDFDGFTVSGRLYAELAALDLRAVNKAAGRLLLVQISPRPALRAELQQLGDDYRGAGAQVTVCSLTMPPIWNLIDEADSAPLVAAVAGWLEEGR